MEVKFEELLGLIIIKILIKKDNDGDDEIKFITNTGDVYFLYHSQKCCEEVYLTDICGDVDDLLNTPILLAEVVEKEDENSGGYKLFSFYKLSTIKGSVTIRWTGTTDSCYSISVDFIKKI